MNKLAIFGSSGHAKDIALTYRENKKNSEIIFIEPNQELSIVRELSEKNFGFVIGIGDNRARKQLADRYTSLRWESVISRRAFLPSDLKLGVGVFIGFGVYLSHNVKIDDHVIINCNSIVGHDAVVSRFAQVSPGVCIGGNGVNLGEGAFIGPNATIINRPIEIGEWSKVGIASVVAGNIPPNTLHQMVYKNVSLGI